MAELAPELLNKLAYSIAYHASGVTGATGHTTDFGGELTVKEMAERIKSILTDPDTQYIGHYSNHLDVDKVDYPENLDTLYFFNHEQQSFVIFNPNQLRPDIEINGSSGDNFAGTFYREPKLNENGEPVSNRSGRVYSEQKAYNEFKGQVKMHLKNVADEQGINREAFKQQIQKIGDSDEWVHHLNRYADEIDSGLLRGIQEYNLAPVAGMEVQDAGKNANGLPSSRATSNAADTAADAASAARFGSNIPIVGAGVGIGAIGLIRWAQSGQRETAEQMYEQGRLSEKALEAYQEMNQNMENMFMADAGIGVADPTGGTIVLSGAAEAWARNQYRDWAEEHAPQLSPEEYDALSLSMLPNQAPVADVVDQISDRLKDYEGDTPEALQVFETLDSYNEARKALDSHTPNAMPAGGQRDALWDDVWAAEDQLDRDILEALYSEAGFDALMDIVPPEDMLDYTRLLAASFDRDVLAEGHPEIADYIQAEENTGWLTKTFSGGLAEEDALLENPQYIHNFLKDKMGVGQSHDLDTAPDFVEPGQVQVFFARVEKNDELDLQDVFGKSPELQALYEVRHAGDRLAEQWEEFAQGGQMQEVTALVHGYDSKYDLGVMRESGDPEREEVAQMEDKPAAPLQTVDTGPMPG